MIHLIGLYLLVCSVNCVTHWKITDDGRIESNEDSAFTLNRPYDLAAFLRQTQSFDRLNELNKILASREVMTKKDSYKNTPVSVAGYQEKFYESDFNCINAGQHLTKFTFYETHFISWRSETIRLPKDIMNMMHDITNIEDIKKPYCTVDLPFNMETFDHIESVQTRSNFTMIPERELSMNLVVDDENLFGHLVNEALKRNSSSWVYLSMASDFFRVKGDFKNSIICLQRSIYYSPRRFKSIPLLYMSNMLHKLHFINDSISVLSAGISIDYKNPLLAYYMGNIHVTNGDLNEARKWYKKSFSLDPKFHQSELKMHAVCCHIKLEIHLEEQHVNLQKKLNELNNFQKYSDEWLHLNNKLNKEKSSANRRKFTQNFYENYMNNSTNYICKWHINNSNEFSNTICKRQPINHSISLNEHEKLNDSNNLRNQRGKNLSSFECMDGDGSFDSAIFSSLSTQLKRVFNKHMFKRRVFQLEDHTNEKQIN